MTTDVQQLIAFVSNISRGPPPGIMSGIECCDRLAALQRVIDHELTHLIEMLIRVDWSCLAPRFHCGRRFHPNADKPGQF